MPVLEIMEQMESIIYPRNNTKKVSTAAMTWLSVTEDRNRPMAMAVIPKRKYARIDR